MPFFLFFLAFSRKRKSLIAFLALTSSTVMASEKVVVELENGHHVIGNISESNEQPDSHIWVIREDSGIRIESGFPRNKVVSVKAFEQSQAEQLPFPKNTADSTQAPLNSASKSEQSNSVESAKIFAAVGNWDNDSLSDGIEVFVQPLDKYGKFVKANGTIDFQLLGQRTAWKTQEQLKYFHDFDLITTWTKPLSTADLTPDGYRFRLEFRNDHPDYDLDIELEAMLQARLNLRGQKALEANSGPVLMRGFSVLRDDRQQFTGSRFFPQEHAPGL